MARTHGFRVYVVEAFKNRKAHNEPEDASVGSAVRRELLALVEALHRAGTHRLEPREPRTPGEPRRPTESVSIGEPQVLTDGLIHVHVAAGEEGSHGWATRPNEEPRDLRDWSPEAGHFITLIFPKTGTRFLLVAQTIRRKDAVPQLLRLLTAEGLAVKKRAVAAEEAARESLREKGAKLPPKQTHDRLLFDRHLAADTGYLTDILISATSASARFEARVPSDRGGERPVVRRTLSIRLLDEKDRDIARAAGRQWSSRQRKGEQTPMSQGVSELADLLEEEELLAEGEANEYNAASIRVQSPDGGTTIAVDTLRDVFTYPVSDGQPSAYYYYEKVSSRLTSIALEEGLEIDFLDAQEVSKWLDDSISGPSSTG